MTETCRLPGTSGRNGPDFGGCVDLTSQVELVELRGLEPLTPTLPAPRSKDRINSQKCGNPCCVRDSALARDFSEHSEATQNLVIGYQDGYQMIMLAYWNVPDGMAAIGRDSFTQQLLRRCSVTRRSLLTLPRSNGSTSRSGSRRSARLTRSVKARRTARSGTPRLAPRPTKSATPNSEPKRLPIDIAIVVSP
jgi:hypothetical protein